MIVVGCWSASEEIADIEVVFRLIGDFASLLTRQIGFTPLGIIFVKIVTFPIGFEFVPLLFRIGGNFDQNIVVRHTVYIQQPLFDELFVSFALIKTTLFRKLPVKKTVAVL